MPFTIRLHRLILPLAYFSSLGLLLTPLLLSVGPAYAEWMLIYQDTQLGLTIYVDPDTIRRKGEVVKWWELYDFKTIQTLGDESYLSIKGQHEYDCAEELNRSLTRRWFSGNMGSGKVLGPSSFPEQKWVPVEPASIGQFLWKFACAKK